ncbi:MAG: acyl-CoA dehydrogenase [Pseudomonadota bacterium]
MSVLLWIILLFGALFAIAKSRASFLTACLVTALVLFLLTIFDLVGGWFAAFLWLLLLVVAIPLNVTGIRKQFISAPLLNYIRKALPPMSDTERTAIEAGTVWWEAELFQGNPDWEKLLRTPAPSFTEEEQAFIDGPIETLCGMIDDWQITHELKDLPEDVWQFMKDNGVFGLMIPKAYGGHEFSALAHSQIVMKIASRSVSAGSTAMVPNSLGPGELLLHYGTEEQKDYYLPRLAKGKEIPCFALTGPTAGSDAGAIPDYGIVCEGEHNGEKVLGLRVTWDKRYITLGPVATILGLAFKAYDPDKLLGDVEELGVTCALIPTDTPGVIIGNRHFPVNQAFMNGPNSGKDVFIPMEWIIGGQDMVGQGWRMLMESLSTGRGVSLPSSGTACGKFVSRTTGAYARVRHQFGLPIAKFEGVEEALARIAGLTYMMDAGRLLTCAGLDLGEKPSVISAILKYHNTEQMRQVMNDAMDVHGGRGICMGPNNYLARAYQGVPVGITVEGANILTRSMIIFGQGAMRCHPFVIAEIEAASHEDPDTGLDLFDQALFQHFGYTVQNGARALLFGLTRSKLADAPVRGDHARYYKRLARMSAAFAFIADLALLFLGGSLKRKEKLSGRFADALTYTFICSAVLKRFEDTGRPVEDEPLMEWGVKYSLYQVQNALDEILRNFPNRLVGQLMRAVVFPLGRRFRAPNDALGHRVAQVLLSPSDALDRLTDGIYISDDPSDITGKLEYALANTFKAEPISKRLKDGEHIRPYDRDHDSWLSGLVAADVISEEEAETLRVSHAATADAIAVDDFAPGQL